MDKKRKNTPLLNCHYITIVDDDTDSDHDHHHQQPTTDIDASVHEENKATTKNDVILVEGLESIASCDSVSVPCCKDSTCVDKIVSGERSKMDDFTFRTHMENIWRSFPENKRTAFSHLDSASFFMYRSKQFCALERIKRKDIFSKKYVFVPIVCWDHWRLVIFCHFGEDVNSEIRSRCILLLDSTEMCANVIEPDLRKFVFDIFTAHSRPEGKDVIYRIPLLIPKVPQQTNGVDCGRFVLYFIKEFMELAPENFSHSNGYPYFMKPDWFNVDSVVKFCDKLDEKSPVLNQGIEQVPRRRSQRIRASTFCARKPYRQAKLVPRQIECIVVDCLETSSEEDN